MEDILKKAEAEADKWLAAIQFDVKGYDHEAIIDGLQGLTFEGDQVVVRVADGPASAKVEIRVGVTLALEEINGTKPTEQEVTDKIAELSPSTCIWDVYDAAFYNCSYRFLPKQDHEFAKFNLLPAFAAGAWCLINLGGLIIVVTRPVAHRDQDNRLHYQHGPSIQWQEYQPYFWHGTEVPKSWIEDPEGLDPAEVLANQNAEQRRAGCEIVGWDKILDKLDATKLQEDELGELYLVDLPDAPDSKFVKVICGTGRTFAMPVPPEMETAAQAVATSYGLDITEYKPEVRT